MKKVFMMVAVVAALASCQSKANKGSEAGSDSLAVEVASPLSETSEVYQGTLPAADGPGIDYVLALNTAVNGTDTIYSLEMTYLDAEGPGKNKSFTFKGKQESIRKVVNQKTKRGYKLSADHDDTPVYFVVVNDSTLRLVNENLEEAQTNLNYNLVKVKK
ncbi:copper resistance protein NlpE N-terminal domain-containing protein [Bacteroides reticulotermitis]|uniref:copper resistance protein NlpE N-terminal domain-containing protein n=1 Tax=Bacteroides reticulotermitis TaxID=1133319 RepID=UPI003A85F8CD